MTRSLPRGARIGLFAAGIVWLGVAVWALAAPYTNGEGNDCNPVYRGGGTPRGTEVVMEGAHDACDLKRTDRLMIAVVAVNVAAALVMVSVLLGPKGGNLHGWLVARPQPP